MAYYDRGTAYFHKGEYARALVDFSKAIDLNPQNPIGYIARSAVYAVRKEYNHALADANKAIALEPKLAC
jgi:tetratricopeptide (TPR) repeat protein